ncbi:universal stress protein [Mesonia ostreae]|uniref:Universal stress protein n=1 Tax=Mesonia ostreae TaxID=861110 RepID=A0ABU2KMG8_9FLAO|nr:universal stress protein [Mesonia ostreae]MDT0295894.1 universal stress protein [Mesonia ostreae]
MKTILVPTDFSQQSENALRAAALIAKHQSANLVVVHMIASRDASFTKSQNQNVQETVFHIRLAEKNFVDFLNKDYLKDLSVNQVITKHAGFKEINDVISEHKASLVVMSSHGTSGLHEMLIGSNTEKVIRYSDVPVLVIKDEVATYKMGVGVFASDFSEESIQAYKTAKEYFKDWETEMRMVYVNPAGSKFKNSREINDMLTNFFKKTGENNVSELKNAVSIYSEHSIPKGIFNFSKDINADFIVIPTHARKGIAHILKGSLSEDVANSSTIPVLTLKI